MLMKDCLQLGMAFRDNYVAAVEQGVPLPVMTGLEGLVGTL